MQQSFFTAIALLLKTLGDETAHLMPMERLARSRAEVVKRDHG